MTRRLRVSVPADGFRLAKRHATRKRQRARIAAAPGFSGAGGILGAVTRRTDPMKKREKAHRDQVLLIAMGRRASVPDV